MNARTIRVLGISVLLLAALAPAASAGAAPGAVYVASNAPAGNAVLVFDRAAQGALSPAGSYDTGGLGTGTGLGNQGGLVLSDGQRFLFVVSAASDDVTVFRVLPDGLRRVGVFASGGRRPISLATRGDLLFVLNAGGVVGGADNVAGFRVLPDGSLAVLSGAVAALSEPSTDPAQVSFSASGDFLVVTEKATNRIDVFPVHAGGSIGARWTFDSAGATPFGFASGKRDQLFVSEAFGGLPGASVVSSYRLEADGSLGVLDPTVATTETAACWVVVTNDGRFAYATNTESGTISGFAIGHDGSLDLLDADGVTAETGVGSGPIDMYLSTDGRSLHVLNAGTGTLATFRVLADGGLDQIDTIGGLPMGANGLAAR
jgi:6-phosphogluconolactonase (cycloisomerase 2 family)